MLAEVLEQQLAVRRAQVYGPIEGGIEGAMARNYMLGEMAGLELFRELPQKFLDGQVMADKLREEKSDGGSSAEGE